MIELFKVNARCVREWKGTGGFVIHTWVPLTADQYDKVVTSKYGNFSTKGNNNFITVGKEYELELEQESISKQYGGSYKIISVPSIESLDLDNLTQQDSFDILMECTSSPRIARNILEAYPDFIKKVLTEGKESINTDKISGVGEAYLNAYTRELNDKYKYHHMINRLKDYKIDLKDCRTLCEYYGKDTVAFEHIDREPYSVLIDCLGRSFQAVDDMVLEVHPELKVSEHRCEYVILDALHENERDSGSTRLNGNALYHYIKATYCVPELIPLIVPTVKNGTKIYYDDKSKDVAIMSTYTAECTISQFIKNSIAISTELDIDWQKYTVIDNIEMTPEQARLLEYFCKYNFMVLTGGAGMGKSQSVKGLINLLEDNNLSYVCLTPTGKSSKRLSEFTHRESSTIHRKCLRDGEIWADAVIVDETSMVDIPTLMMLISCIMNPNARIVLVGDMAQLLPVGIGAAFCDIINSGIVPLVRLTKVFRYDSSGMLYVATHIREGKSFFDNEDKLVKRTSRGIKVGGNYEFIESEDIFEDLTNEYMKLISKGISPKDILVLSPMNVGDIGTYTINNALQAEINPPLPNESTMERKIDNYNMITFRKGDIILNKKNDYKALPLDSYNMIQDSGGILSSDDVTTTSIFNGQDGAIVNVDDKKIVAQFDEELIVFDKMKVKNLLLGLSCSTHGAQGSQAKYVINVVSSEHSRMLNKNLLYVADTRSELMHIDIGEMSAFTAALLVDGNDERDTWLLELLKEEREENSYA